MPPPEAEQSMTNTGIKVKASKFRNYLKNPKDFSRWQLALFALGFGIIGSILIYKSFAATNLVASFEAEQMSLPAGGKVVSDPAASGGKAIVLLANGAASGSVNFPSAVTSITVKAKGQQCSGAPLMTVSIDGNSLLNNTAVSSTSWASYSATPTTPLSSGTHSVTVSLNNYYKNPPKCARTLYVDVFYFYGSTTPPAPSPTVSLSATPTSVAVGLPSTLTWTSTNATSCTASGAWSGAQPLSGTTSTGALNQSSTYTLTCSGTGGTAAGSVTVSVITTGKTWNITPTSTPSLATAEQQAQPGDTILLSGAFKNVSLVPAASGTAAAPITYKAASTGGVSFDAAGMTSTLVSISSRSYLVFDGLGFTNSAYSTSPANNRGVILRNSQYITFKNNNFTYMQMQLISASYNTITNNTWSQFVALYSNGQPQTAGDMLAILSGSHDNDISYNNMKYGGHSLIEVGTGWGPANANNHIHDNVLDNPWYKSLILADDGAGTIVENNKILDANSVPSLLSTLPQSALPPSWPKDGKAYSSEAIQFSGSNFILRNNVIDISVSTYAPIGFGCRWYYGAGAPSGGALVESKNNQVYGNTISNVKGAATFAFEQNYTPGTDKSVPNCTGNQIHDNTILTASATSYSWDGSLHYETVMFRGFKGAPLWVGLNGNQIYNNSGFSSTNAYRYSYVNGSGATTTQVNSLAQFQALDPTRVYGNH